MAGDGGRPLGSVGGTPTCCGHLVGRFWGADPYGAVEDLTESPGGTVAAVASEIVHKVDSVHL